MKKTVMIKKNYEFRSVLKKGKCYKGTLVNIFICNNNSDINMFGIAISKKAGNSVKRNKIKRLIRENYKNMEKDIIPGKKIVILWKKDSQFLNFDFYNIKKELESLFTKANIIQGEQ